MPEQNLKAVLFFSNHLRGPKGAAGARSWHQAKAISQVLKLSVIIPAIDPVTACPVTEETYEGLHEKVDVIKVWTTRNNRTSRFERALFFITAMFSQLFRGLIRKRCDLVLSMSLPVTQLGVAWLVSKVWRVPLVVDVRDLPFETAAEIGYLKNPYILQMMKSVESFCLRQSKLVVTNSPRYAPYITAKGVAIEKIHVLPIGYDDFNPPSDELVQNWRSVMEQQLCGQVKFLAIYAGTIGYAFPVEYFLEAAKKLKENKEIGFVFFGDGQRKEYLEAYARSEGLNVSFYGRVVKSDIHAICRAADICLYPAQDGEYSASILGNKVFDYLGALKPIIYSGPDSAVSEIVEKLQAGVICSGNDAECIADAIEYLSQTPERVQELSHNAAGFRGAGYTAGASAKRLTQLLNDVLNKQEN